MTLTVENFDGLVALDTVQTIQQALGTGILSGCAPSLPSSTSPITVDIASGTAYVGNIEHTVNSGSVTLPDGDAQHPRKDVIYVDTNGALQSLQGTPRAPADGTGSTTSTDRHVYQPEPPDLSSLSSLADGAVIAEIWVPAAATGTGDMTDSGVTYVRDRRLRPWPDGVLTTDDEGSGNGLDADTVDGEEASAFADASHTHTSGDVSDFDEAAQDAVGAAATDGLAYDDANDELGLNVIASGSTALSSGEATIDTGVATSTTATFTVFLAPDTDDADVAAEVRSDSGSGNYEVDIVETETSVGNPTVNYDIVRLR